MRLIIHAGMHKTGSSFIQNTLFENADLLAEHGVIYPKTAVSNDTSRGRRHYEIKRSIGMEGAKSFVVSRIRDEIDRSGAKTAVVSYEGLFLPGFSSKALRAAFEGYDATVVVYLRNPVDYIESKYREWLESQKYTGEMQNFLASQQLTLDYTSQLRTWTEAFDGKVVVRSIGHVAGHDGLANDLMAAGGHEVPLLVPTKLTNPSLTNGQALLSLIANRYKLIGESLSGALAKSATFAYPGNGGRLLSDAQLAVLGGKAKAAYEAALAAAGYDAAATSNWASRPFDDAFFDEKVRATATEWAKDNSRKPIKAPKLPKRRASLGQRLLKRIGLR